MAFARLLLIGLVAGCASVAPPPPSGPQPTDPRAQPSPALPPPESLALRKEPPSWMRETDRAEGAEKMQHGMEGGMNMPGMDMPSAPKNQADAPGQHKKGQPMDHSMPGGMKMDKQMPDGMKMPHTGKKKEQQPPQEKMNMKQHDGGEMKHENHQ